jgi:hypothetical protein
MKKLIFGAAAIVVLMAGTVGVELGAQPRREPATDKDNAATRNVEIAAKQKAMIEAARAAYAGILESHSLGRATSNNEVYAWSTRIRSAEVRAANSRQQMTKACLDHLQRMRDLHERVAALGREGAPGGETHRQAATQFYVAEAELLLLEVN